MRRTKAPRLLEPPQALNLARASAFLDWCLDEIEKEAKVRGRLSAIGAPRILKDLLECEALIVKLTESPSRATRLTKASKLLWDVARKHVPDKHLEKVREELEAAQ